MERERGRREREEERENEGKSVTEILHYHSIDHTDFCLNASVSGDRVDITFSGYNFHHHQKSSKPSILVTC